MRRTSLRAVLVIVGALSVNLAWGQANRPNNPNAVAIQGPDPTGQQGYPLATVPATGALPWPVAIQSFAASLAVTQGTSPWIVAGADTPRDAFSTPTNAVTINGLVSVWDGAAWERVRSASVTGDGSSGLGYFASGTNIFDRPTGGYDRLRTVDTNGASQPVTGIQAVGPLLWNGTGLDQQRGPNVFRAVATAATGNTALWTPAAGKKFRLMRYMVTVTDQATQAGPATLTISLLDGAAGVTGQVHDVFVPAIGLVNTGSLYTSGWIDLGNGYLSAATNNVLNINLSAALTAGTVRVICCGTEE